MPKVCHPQDQARRIQNIPQCCGKRQEAERVTDGRGGWGLTGLGWGDSSASAAAATWGGCRGRHGAVVAARLEKSGSQLSRYGTSRTSDPG